MSPGTLCVTWFRSYREHTLIGLAVGAVTFLAGCGAGNSPGTSPQANQGAPNVQTAHVAKQDLARVIELPGTVEGYETAALYAKVGGYLESIAVDIGDRRSEERRVGKGCRSRWSPDH